MKLLNFTIIKLTLCLVLGIVIGYFIPIPLTGSLAIIAILLAVLLVLIFTHKNGFSKTIWYGVIAFLGMITVGVLTVNLHNQKKFAHHYSNYISTDLEELHTVTFRIREVLKPGLFYDKYVIDLFEINNKKAIGKSLLNVKKDSVSRELNVDEFFIVRTHFKNLIQPLNPGQFNYKNYLKRKYIYHQLFTEYTSILQCNTKGTTIFGIANSIREHINTKLEPYNFKPDELAIINALLLGQRQDISKEVYTSYTNAGAIHILAVSGLHVGIILLMLSLVLKPLERFKHGKLIKTLLLVVMLWSFAVIAGLSASVTRAVTMFSIVAIGMNLNRPTNIYNTLAISILVILLIKPLFLFDVGFQLSYLAVLAIVTIDPVIYKLWQPKNWLLDKYWHTFTITIAAQFGIIPVSLYYFHQFPGLFFISNLVIIPLLGVILAFGVLVILLAVLNMLPKLIALFFGAVIHFMNTFIGWVSQQEAFILKNIPFHLLHVLVFYGLTIVIFKWYFKKNYTNLKYVLIAVILLQCAFIYTEYSKPENQFIVFHKSRYTLIGDTYNHHITFAHNFDSITALKTNVIRDYAVNSFISPKQEQNIASVYRLKDKLLLVVDSLGIYNVNRFKPDYILLRQSPKINLNRLIDSLKPKQIIADGSNYKSYIENWEATCKKRKLPFHQTSKKGAFILDY